MVILLSILIFCLAFLTSSAPSSDADVQVKLYSYKHRELVWGISQRQVYMPNKAICTILSVGFGLIWIELNFYKFENEK